ncbi:MAG: 3-phosphoshikimate 1-carboxyvinyltransferase, partial [Bacteroidota bacterium]
MATTTPLRGETELPGDKSISHRALLVGALAEGVSRIQGLSEAADLKSTASCLRSLGIRVEEDASGTIVQGRGLHGLRVPNGPLDCENSGTTIRLLTGILAGSRFESVLTGDESLRRRPMERVAEPLRLMGAAVGTTDLGTAPIRIRGAFPLQSLAFVPQIPSAQVKSAVLLAGLFAEGETVVVERVPTRDHTERMLGLTTAITPNGLRISVRGGLQVQPREISVPGDVSAAVFMACAAAIVPGSDVLLRNVGVNPGRARVLQVLRSWGVPITETNLRTTSGEPIADLHISHGYGDGDMHLPKEDVASCIDEIPALACLALAARRGFSVRGASELRAKETDRILQLTLILRTLGVDVEEYSDGF